MQTAIHPLFLQAFEGKNEHVPVWFMRQAGRYLPEYQVLKSKYSLNEMFSTPELAAEITCMPIDILGVDAAILFADILTLPAAMGFNITFDNQKGPIIEPKGLDQGVAVESIPHVEETIKLVKERLGEKTPLIGFAGAPFTVLTYLVEGGSSTTYRKTFELMAKDAQLYHHLMSHLSENTIRYYQLQQQSGIDAFQLFDSWAGILDISSYEEFVLPYIIKIFKAINLPSIYFVKNTAHLFEAMDQCSADFLSVDHTITIGDGAATSKTHKGLQGNLFNRLLFADATVIQQKVEQLLVTARNHPKYIFNLSHGIFPGVEVDTLKRIVDQVHTFSWKT